MMCFPIVLPIDETKNMITFMFYLNGNKVIVMKDDFKRALKEFWNWRSNSSATNFSAGLFNLMSHADCLNVQKFCKGFPEEAIVYSLWYNSATEETFKKIVENYILKEGETNDTITT